MGVPFKTGMAATPYNDSRGAVQFPARNPDLRRTRLCHRRKYVPVQEAKMGFSYSGEARKIGFHNGGTYRWQPTAKNWKIR